jgi:hypothetical protein
MDLIRRVVQTDWGATEYVGSTPINASLSGDNVIVSGSATLLPGDIRLFAIVAFGYVIIPSGNVQIAFAASDGTVISGPYDILSNGGMFAPNFPSGHFATPRGGQGVNLLLGGAVHVGGHFKFGLVPRL